MSDAVIKLENVNKHFRRFKHPGWRALDAFNIKVPRSRYDIFQVLSDINLEINRSERVALIGRNGAGKSTLLRLIAGQMRADTGRVKVVGRIQALMELGTGFHPDFTGIENIRASLAFQGLSGKVLKTKIEEVIDFTELEAFIERPVREYSAGMYARLAFVVATTIEPEVLIVDEILGAGDAYFVGKSIQRMKRLTDGGATVLFVSHDISSVQALCERAVWIDEGKIKKDGDIVAVSKAYLMAVREDEEVRVRARSMSITKQQVLGFNRKTTPHLFRLIGENGQPPGEPLYLAQIRYGDGDTLLGSILPTNASSSGTGLILDSKRMNWRGPKKNTGKLCWQFGDFGGIYQHAPWQIDWPEENGSDPWIELDIIPSLAGSVFLEQFDEETDSYKRLMDIDQRSLAQWKTLRVRILKQDRVSTPVFEDMALQKMDVDDRYGSSEILINGFGFFDVEDVRRHTLISGEPASAIISYSTKDRTISPVAVVAVYKPDGSCAMQVVSNRDASEFSSLSQKGLIRVTFNPLYLGVGDYIVSVALFRELNIASRAEPEAYDLHDRCYALKVMSPVGVGVELGTVNQPATWELLK